MSFMSIIPDNFRDVAIVDPEYGIGESGKNHKTRNTLIRQKDGHTLRRAPSGNYSRKDWDNKAAGPEYFAELKRVTRNQIIFGANYFESIYGKVEKPPRRNQYDQFLKDHPVGYIIWDKVNGNNDFSDCEVIYTSFNFPSEVIYYMWAGMMQGTSILNGTIMQGDKALNEKRIHPTQKPVIIYKYLLHRFVKPKETVLDTHGGSMSIVVACYDYEVPITCIEKDPEYFDKSSKRIKKHARQIKMLFPE